MAGTPLAGDATAGGSSVASWVKAASCPGGWPHPTSYGPLTADERLIIMRQALAQNEESYRLGE